MFDLDHEIAQWRRAMAAGGVHDPVVLDELESHLRDDVEQQVRSGCDVVQAFKAATERIGEAGALNREFVRANKTLSFAGFVSVLDDRRKCFWGAVVVAAVASIGFYWWNARVTPTYAGVTTVQLLQRSLPWVDSRLSMAANDVQSAERLNMVLRRLVSGSLRAKVAASLTPAEQKIIRRAAVTRNVSNELQPAIYARMGALSVIPQRLSLLVTLSVAHEDAEAAALLANRYAEQCRMDIAKSSDSQKMSIRIVKSASTPSQPIAPNFPRILRASIGVAIITFLSLMIIGETLRMLAHMWLNLRLKVRTS